MITTCLVKRIARCVHTYHFTTLLSSLSLEMLFVYADGFHPCRGDAEVPSALLKSPAAE